jgi:hypothetical protein
METIIIQADNEEQAKLVKSFLQEHKLRGRVLSDEDKEDIVLGRLMEETNYEEVVDTDSFIASLRKK